MDASASPIASTVRGVFRLQSIDPTAAGTLDAMPGYLAAPLADSLHWMVDIVGLRTSLAKARLEEVDELFEVGMRSWQPGSSDRETRENPIVRPGPEHASTHVQSTTELAHRRGSSEQLCCWG